MKSSNEVLQDIGIIANPLVKKTQTSGDGSGMTALPAIMKQPNPSLEPQDVQAIQSRMLTLKPYQIDRQDQKALQIASNVLELALTPTTYDQAVYWVTRMLAHFPRRDVAGDGVVIADLSAAMVENRVAIVAVMRACEDAWKAATKKNPFMPPSGDTLAAAIKETKSIRDTIDSLKRGPAMPADQAPKEKPRYSAELYADFSDADRLRFVEDLKKHTFNVRLSLCRVYEAPESLASADQ